jgi:hypothetical protein
LVPDRNLERHPVVHGVRLLCAAGPTARPSRGASAGEAQGERPLGETTPKPTVRCFQMRILGEQRLVVVDVTGKAAA